MQFLVILMAVACASAADAVLEVYTLSDGRVLRGVWNEETGILALEGGKASLPVAAALIAKRVPVPVDEALDPIPEKGANAPSMTPAEKAAAMAKFMEVKKEKERKAILDWAARMESDAAAYEKKAATRHEQAMMLSSKSRSQPGNNIDTQLVNLVIEEERYKTKAKELRDEAKRKRASVETEP